MSTIMRSVRISNRPRATALGRNGAFQPASIQAIRWPLLDSVALYVLSRRTADMRRPALQFTLSTPDMRKLHRALGDILDAVEANKQSERVREESIEMLGVPLPAN